MKLSRLLVMLALPLSIFACAAGVQNGTTSTGASSGDGGSGGGSGGSGGTGTTSTMTTTSTGTPGTCTKKDDCTALDDPCNSGNCVNGMCQKTQANEGATCDDGLFCTDNDVCKAGKCEGGTPKFCPSPDSCHLGQCDEAIKGCGAGIPGNDGAPCNDNDACTQTGTCNAGTCEKGPPIDCSFLDGVCSKGICDVGLGCIISPLSDGDPCDDGLYCTVEDACTLGVCTGKPNTCAAPGNTCMIGSCNEAQKTCVAVPGNDGMMCDDQNPCTQGSVCANGACVNGLPANNGMACVDKDGCTLGTTCTNGTCGNPTSSIALCIDGDSCCPPGCVGQGDTDCSVTKWSEGTMAWPDQACNPQNSFGNCDTNAQPHADAWATKVCQGNGFTSGIWTGNKQPGCTGQISMYCGGQIPCAPIYENMCFASDQTKVEITCFP
jgi:hypothetical protein